MNKEQKMVEEFHKAFDILVADKPCLPDDETRALRVSLIQEEFAELVVALVDEDLVEVADALADLLYVVYGAGLSFGLDLEPLFTEVHRSNMSKTGGRKREDGKWEKPESYSKAKLKPIIDEMTRRANNDTRNI